MIVPGCGSPRKKKRVNWSHESVSRSPHDEVSDLSYPGVFITCQESRLGTANLAGGFKSIMSDVSVVQGIHSSHEFSITNQKAVGHGCRLTRRLQCHNC